MIDLYGATVDHPDFHSAFRLVMDTGGTDNPHMRNLDDFTSVHVNPKLRNLRFETYATVAALPLLLPRLKIALLKWTWKQPPMKTWCPTPPNILHRFEPNSQTTLREVADDMEHAMEVMANDISPVVQQTQNKSKRILWLAEVDIGLMQRLIAAPKKEEGKTLQNQEMELTTKCGDLSL